MRLPNLEILDKTPVTLEDKEAANNLKEQLEKEKQEAEEQEKLKLELEAENAAAAAAKDSEDPKEDGQVIILYSNPYKY